MKETNKSFRNVFNMMTNNANTKSANTNINTNVPIKKTKDILEIRRIKIRSLYEREDKILRAEMGTRNLKIDEQSTMREVDRRKEEEISFLKENLKTVNYKKQTPLHVQTQVKVNVESELDRKLRHYSENLDVLKIEDFMSRKKMQDDLLININLQMEKLKFGLNDKSYEEKVAHDYFKSKRESNENEFKDYKQINTSNNINNTNNYNNYNNFSKEQLTTPMIPKNDRNVIVNKLNNKFF